MSHDVAAALAPWFAVRLGAETVEIADVVRHVEGWSWQTYTMTVRWRDASGAEHTRGFAVRREPEDGLLAPYDIDQQYRLHRAVLEHSQVPMPALFWLETDPAVLGMPFYVMERVEGMVPVQWRGDDPAIFPDEATRRAIGLDFVRVLAQIHAIDIAAAGLDFLGVPPDAETAARDQIRHWEEVYERDVLVEVPLLRMCIAWLRDNVATTGRVSLVHGDYRIGNFMLGPDRRIRAVFDWELAHLGDPAFDVAWAGMPLFRGRSPKFSHLLERAEFLAAYREATGIEVSEDVFRFWTVFGHLRAVGPHLTAARAFETGRAADVRLAAMGHQSLYILRRLAEELGLGKPARGQTEPAPVGGTGAMQNSPQRLLEGTAERLALDVAPKVDDPYAAAQVRAAVEVLRNVASRGGWETSRLRRSIAAMRRLLDAAAVETGSMPPEETGTIDAQERTLRAAVARLASWVAAGNGSGALRERLVEFLLADLGEESALLRSGMYRQGGPG